MRLLFRLLLVTAITLVAIVLPSSPAQAQETYIRLSPNDGVPGEEITVYGYCFTANEWVDIYYDGALVDLFVSGSPSDGVKADDDGDFRASFVIPESYTGPHEVLAKDEEDVEAEDDFTVEPGLIIDTEEGPVGTSVTIDGFGFAEDEEDIELLYYLDGGYETIERDISADDKGSWERSFQIPSSVRGYHKIDAWGDDSDLGDVHDATFEVMPEIQIIDPVSGAVIEEPSGTLGESIPITGSGFDGEDSYIKVLFAGEETEAEPEIIRADENGDWEASFWVPDMPAGTYIVTAEGQSTREEDVNSLAFTIASGLLLSPNEGHVGTNVTVRGGGFIPDDVVVIKYEGNEVETARTDEEGTFEVSFPVPESKHGARNVTAEVGGETVASAIFIMESDPPDKPELISPSDGDSTGFIGKFRPTFEWSEVSDDSGVYYSLRIWTADNVTKISKVALVGANYTLIDIEALPQGSYYWSVQAVDGAENESGWTEARYFRVGAMPLWAFVVLMVAAAGGIGTLVYFRWIKQRIYYY